MSKTKIEWADRVWNPITGCTKVSAGCKNCYAETYAKRFWGDRKFTDVLCHEDRSAVPMKLKKPQRIFVNSMSDLFHEHVPFSFIWEVYQTMATCHRHTFVILTKRPERAAMFYDLVYRSYPDLRKNPDWPLRNIWLGVSVEDQATADERIPVLLKIPAAVRWISAEPLLGKIKLRNWLPYNTPISIDPSPKEKFNYIDWIVCGGESGPNARPMHPDWARSLRDQCQDANIPFFFKQWGEFVPDPEIRSLKNDRIVMNDGSSIGHFDREVTPLTNQLLRNPIHMVKIGKSKSGRLLDGREWNEFPKNTEKTNNG